MRVATDIAGSIEEVIYLYKDNYIATVDYRAPQYLVSVGRIGRMIFTQIQAVSFNRRRCAPANSHGMLTPWQSM
jgi:hypothetical protein